MAYIDLYYHFVFRTKHSLRVIDEEHEDKLYNYIYGISSHLGCNIKKIVRNYISNQKTHHHKMSLNEELESFFKAAGIEEKLQYFLCDK